MLVLEVCAGMANRLRALVSGICLAEDLGKKLHVIWPANEPTCIGRFESLFERSSLPSWVTINLGPLQGDYDMVLSPDDLEVYLAKGEYKSIKSYGWFHTKDQARWLKHYRALKPIPVITDAIQKIEFLRGDAREIIGVHIRRGDHQKARLHSSGLSFIKEMRTYPETTRFLVATDDMTERNMLLKEFGSERLYFPATSLSRMTLRGMQDALLDFMCLAKTSRILGSYNSSFSELAALYGDVTLQVIKNEPAN